MRRADMPSAALQLDLGELANPKAYCQPVELGDVDCQKKLAQLRSMIEIRVVEEIIGELVRSGEVRCPCHLSIGQEAIAVGTAAALRRSDRLFGNHRSHAHYLAIGAPASGLFAEVLGRSTGCSRGMGGSMHLYAPEFGLQGTLPIVAGTIPVAVGAALAIRLRREDAVAVCYFGDGAVEEGVFHESLNLAAHRKLPVLFVCENNLYSSHLDIALRQPHDRMARYADAQGVFACTVDGNDLVAVEQAALHCVQQLRAGDGPAFLEAVTYRHRGHVGPDENVDVGLRRKREDLAAWKQRDPITRLVAGLVAQQALTPAAYELLCETVREECLSVCAEAKQAAYPDTELLWSTVYRGR